MPELPLQEAFNLAVQHHQAGHLREAEQIYRQILAREPRHADSLHLLGVIAHQIGRHDVAISLIRQAIGLCPNFPEAYSNLGNVLKEKGQHADAIACFRHAIALKPNYPDALNNLGVSWRDAGQLDDAMQVFRQAIALEPNSPEALCNLAMILKDKGQLDEALVACRRSIALLPGLSNAHSCLAGILRENGHLAEALAACRQAVVLLPDSPDAHNNLGIVLNDMGRHDEAITAYRRAIALKPNVSETYNNLGIVLKLTGQLGAAIAAFRQAIALNASFFGAYNNLGVALCAHGQLEEALPLYRRALELKPAFTDALSNLGVALWNLGQFAEAADAFRRALSISPEAQFYRGLVLTGRRVAEPAEIQRLQALLSEPDLPLAERIAAGFVLGKVLDEAERYDEAFAQYAAANRLFKQSCAAKNKRFDGAELQRTSRDIMEQFAPPLFAARSSWGNPSDLPVFIVGMPRSGTSLVEQIAASHPAVHGAGELELIRDLSGALRGDLVWSTHGGAKTNSYVPATWNPDLIAATAESYLAHLRTLHGSAARITDKMPANIFHLGLIALMFPRARVIFCRRDGRDNCLSCHFEQFSENSLLYTYDLADCARQYVETDRLINHWLGALPLQMLEVQYESLVAEPEAQSRRLIEFLGLPWDPACLEFYRTKRPVLTASSWQVRQPIYTRSVGRWRHYQRHLAPLLEVLNEVRPEQALRKRA